MLQLNWHSITITTNQQANDMLQLFFKTHPTIGAFDTESNGLHIIHSTPFLFQFGWLDPNGKDGYTFVIDIEKQPKLAHAVIKAWLDLAKQLQLNLAHNTKFDMHMLKNIGYNYPVENLSDTMFYIRHAHDTIPQSAGGPPLGLKEYTAQYITPHAKQHEKLLKKEQSDIAKQLNLKLKNRLKNCGTPPPHFKAKSYTLGVLQEMFKDVIFDYNDLPEEIKTEYFTWLNDDVPLYLQKKITGLVESDMISYNKLNRENMIKYAHHDIIYVLEIYHKLNSVIQARENQLAIDIENSLLFPLYEMERVGFKADKEYLKNSQQTMKEYIKTRRNKLHDIAQQEFSIGQHELIKKILYNEFDLEVTSTGEEKLENLRSQLIRNQDNPTAIEFIETILELRTLEKWYSTYIMRFLYELQNTNRLHTQISQVGAVSGRVSSNFQQFPRKPIKDINDQELFHPRKLIIPSNKALVYIDYSQIELRIQALYTILVGHPDTNLCRAFMPYNCITHDGILFDYNLSEHINNWDKQNWYLQEDPTTLWEPVDLHGIMGTEIYNIEPDESGFDEARYVGKRVNFAKNFGAKRPRIKAMFPDKPEEEITKIDNAYYNSFPGITHYQNYCHHRAEYASTTNLFGAKYFNASGHKLINLLIQGSAAFFLKLKIREIYNYTKKHNIKSHFQMNIHDELSWEKDPEDSPQVFFDFKEIMETWPDTLVPIVADISISTQTWADKKEVSDIEEFRVHLGF